MNIANLFATLGFKTDHAPLDALNEKLEGVKRRLEFLGAAEIIRGIYELTERYSGFSEELGSAATAAGLTVEALQKIQYAAGLAGVSAEEISGGLARITRQVYDARNGNEQAIELFRKAGISKEQIGSFKTGRDALLAFADSIRGMADPVAKQALVVDLLGRGGRNMVEFLQGGSEEIEKFGAKAEAAGAVISTKTIVALREMEDAMSSMWRVFKTFGATIAGIVAPAVRDAANIFSTFLAVNKDILQLSFKQWIDALLYGIGFLIGTVLVISAKLLDFINLHPGLIKAAKDAALAIIGLSLFVGGLGWVIDKVKKAWALLMLVFRLSKIPFQLVYGFIGQLVRGLGWLLVRLATLIAVELPALSAAIFEVGAALLTLELPLILAAVVAVALAFQTWYTVLTGGSLKDTWAWQMYDKIKSAGGGVKGFLKMMAGDMTAQLPTMGVGEGTPSPMLEDEDGYPVDNTKNPFNRVINQLRSQRDAIRDLRENGRGSAPGEPGYGVWASPEQNVNIANTYNLQFEGGATPAEIVARLRKMHTEQEARSINHAKRALKGVQVQ